MIRPSNNKIKILLHGEPYHTKMFEDQLKANSKGIFEPKYFEILNDNINYNDFDLFHLISPPLISLRKLKQYKKPMIYQWIGSDVQRIIQDSFLKRLAKKRLIKSTGAFNLVVIDSLKKELIEIGISSEIFPLVNLNFVKQCPPFPKKFSILSYVPENRWDFYHGDMILQLAKNFPDIDFHILAAGDTSNNLSNVFTYGFVDDIESFYIKSNVLLRFTIHDGLPKMVLEALSFGRQVLWNEFFPHCHLVKNQKDCIKALTSLKSNPLYNKAGKDYVEVNYHPQKLCDNYLTLCKKIIEHK